MNEASVIHEPVLEHRLRHHVVALADAIGERNVHYHTAADTPEKIAYAPMARVVDGLAKAIGVLADSATLP